MLSESLVGTRQSQVSEQCDKLNRATISLNETIKSLEDRLNGILIPASPTVEADKEDTPRLVDLANDIRQQTKKVEVATNTISSLIARIEI